MSQQREDKTETSKAHLVLIVVGSSLRAERADRPLGYKLQRRITKWVREHQDQLELPIDPLVCSDVWYLNHEELHVRPTLCVGGPGVNALSAYFVQHLAQGTIDPATDQIVLQMDPEFTDLRVCIWGMNTELTAKGLDLFCKEYLAGYLRAVATQVEPDDV